MGNVLTDLAADIYKAADTVGRSLTGFIPSCMVNTDGSESARAAVGGIVRSHFTRRATVVTTTPSMTIPEGTDQTVDNKTLTINKTRSVQIPWTGEDIKAVNNGSGFETIYGDQLKNAFEALANEIETDLAIEAYKNASRAFGSAGTTPFGSNFNEIAEIRQILVDNGIPINDRRTTLVLNTAAGTNLRQLANLQKVNESGNEEMLRRGTLLDLQGLMLKESAQVQLHTKGAGTGYDVDLGAGYAIGSTTIHLDGGTVNVTGIKAGDVVTFAADTVNKYVVNTGTTDVEADIVLGSPGLRIAAADADEMTIGNSYTANVAFHQSALELAIRAPAMPLGGDAAVDLMVVQDPVSGLVFQLGVYKGFQKMMINVGAVWGVKAWKPDFIALLLG